MILVLAMLLVAISHGACAQGMKPHLRGLISMGWLGFLNEKPVNPNNRLDTSFAAHGIDTRPGVFDGIAINVAWAQLQPRRDMLDTAAIDDALAQIAAYNRRNPANKLGARLRVFGANVAPDWVKQLDPGGRADPLMPVTVLNALRKTVTVPRFWENAVQAAYRRLMTSLAGIYDANPLMRGVSVTSCASRGDEPFILPLDPMSLGNLHAAGFDDAAYQACLQRAVHDLDAWHRTPLDFAFNEFQQTDGAAIAQNTNFTCAIMKEWVDHTGAQGIIMNHALAMPDEVDNPRRTALYRSVYECLIQEKARGADLQFQMNSPHTKYWPNAVRYAESLGSTALELWPPLTLPDGTSPFQGFDAFPAGQLSQWRLAIKGQ